MGKEGGHLRTVREVPTDEGGNEMDKDRLRVDQEGQNLITTGRHRTVYE